MKSEKEIFFSELRKIQDFAIGTSLCKQNKYQKIEDMLEDITYDVIFMMCEMIDGYRNSSIKYKIVNMNNNNILNDKNALHDECEAFLRCTDI